MTYFARDAWHNQAPIVLVVRLITAEAIEVIHESGGYVFQQKPTVSGGYLAGLTGTSTFGVEFPQGTQHLPHGSHACFALPNGRSICLKPWGACASLSRHSETELGVQVCHENPPVLPLFSAHPPQQQWRCRSLNLLAQVALGCAGATFDEQAELVTLPVDEMFLSDTCNTGANIRRCWYLPTGVKVHIDADRFVPGMVNDGLTYARMTTYLPFWTFTVCSAFSEEITFVELSEEDVADSGDSE